ncbi:MAG: hypothetical protein K6E40_10150 [Desulfovibrio sp.]|nr:hypothetical protein [Desulfovibrio sp.]
MRKISGNLILDEDGDRIFLRVTSRVYAEKLDELGIQSSPLSFGRMYVLPRTEGACMQCWDFGEDATECAPFLDVAHPLVEGKYRPMKHQLATAAFATIHPRCYVLNDPRTGKTGSMCLAMDYMRRRGMVTGGWLIVTTVTTIDGVWIDVLKSTCPGARIERVHGRGRRDALDRPADYYVTNYDSMRIEKDAFCKAVKERRIGACVIDELTHVGNPSSQRFKAIDAVVNGCGVARVVGMTGSPGNNPETVYGMCRMVNSKALPCRTKRAWMDMVTYQYGPEPYMRKPSADAPATIYAAMQPAVRFAKADVLDLPPVVTQTRRCPLSSEQSKAMEGFRRQATAMLDSGVKITAANGGVLCGKLMQTAQGFVMDNEGNPRCMKHDARTRTILECVAETSRKAVVFGVYVAANWHLQKELCKVGFSAEVIDGSVSARDRTEILRRFQTEASPRVLVCHPTTTAYGVDLAAADTLIFNGPPLLGGFVYAQALERLSSSKQTARSIQVIRIVASPEEEKFFGALDRGQEMGDFIAALFQDMKKRN